MPMAIALNLFREKYTFGKTKAIRWVCDSVRLTLCQVWFSACILIFRGHARMAIVVIFFVLFLLIVGVGLLLPDAPPTVEEILAPDPMDKFPPADPLVAIEKINLLRKEFIDRGDYRKDIMGVSKFPFPELRPPDTESWLDGHTASVTDVRSVGDNFIGVINWVLVMPDAGAARVEMSFIYFPIAPYAQTFYSSEDAISFTSKRFASLPWLLTPKLDEQTKNTSTYLSNAEVGLFLYRHGKLDEILKLFFLV